MASKDAEKPAGVTPDTAPDPDEDDLDDLDEMLDEFSATKIDPSPTAPSASGPGRPPTASKEVPEPTPDEFEQTFQAGMEQMLQDLESDPEMAKQFETLMAQFSGAAAPPAASSSTTATTTKQPDPTDAASTHPAAMPDAASKAAKPNPEDAFQDTIKRTMDRMKASSSSADAAASKPSPFEDDMMASLLRELQAADGGEGGDEAFSKMLLGMMEQLTNKDILYEPMRELNDKFPAWLAEKGPSLPAEDRERYETQKALVAEIVARFEKKGYSDADPDDREYIVERMQKMQAAGAPPPELVGDVDAANEMMQGLDQGCPQQ